VLLVPASVSGVVKGNKPIEGIGRLGGGLHAAGDLWGGGDRCQCVAPWPVSIWLAHSGVRPGLCSGVSAGSLLGVVADPNRIARP